METEVTETVQNIWEFGSQLFEHGLLFFCIWTGLVIIATKIISHFVKGIIRKAEEHNASQTMALQFVYNVIHFVIWFLAVYVILSETTFLSGLSTAVLGAGSLISVVVGLAAQETFGNLIAGLFLAMYHPFDVGDTVLLKEKDISGKVEQITFRHTILRTIENTKVIVPNSVMNTAILEDRVYGQDFFTKYISFDISYESNLEKAVAIIQEDAMKVEEIIDTRSDEERKNNVPPFLVRLDEFDESGIRLTFPIVTTDLGSSLRAASELRKMLLKDFGNNAIEIPYQKIQIIDSEKDK